MGEPHPLAAGRGRLTTGEAIAMPSGWPPKKLGGAEPSRYIVSIMNLIRDGEPQPACGQLRLTLFGCMSATDSTGRSYLPRTQKSQALLAILALASPRLVPRQHLAALLWSRRETQQARASLRQSVGELRKALGPTWGHLFVSGRRHVSLRGAGLEIDALSAAPTPPSNAPDWFGDVLLEEMTGLDPAFDRWLDDARARFDHRRRVLADVSDGGHTADLEQLERVLLARLLERYPQR